MGRDRGYWWAPDGDRLLVARVDNTRVQRWYVADPTNPAAPPTVLRYPVAGTANAEVTLWILSLNGDRTPVPWNRDGYEYLTAVHWSRCGLIVAVQNRAQTSTVLLDVDPHTGLTRERREDQDPAWVAQVPGLPAFTSDGALVWAADIGDTCYLVIDGQPVTPAHLQVREVLDIDNDTVLFSASDEPTEIHLWTYSPTTGLHRVTRQSGTHRGRRAGGTLVVVSETANEDSRVTVHRADGRTVPIRSLAEAPLVKPQVGLLR
jgi:dipeptidyl-peptidase 4